MCILLNVNFDNKTNDLSQFQESKNYTLQKTILAEDIANESQTSATSKNLPYKARLFYYVFSINNTTQNPETEFWLRKSVANYEEKEEITLPSTLDELWKSKQIPKTTMTTNNEPDEENSIKTFTGTSQFGSEKNIFTKFGDNIALPSNLKGNDESHVELFSEAFQKEGELKGQPERRRTTFSIIQDNTTLPTNTERNKENDTDTFAKEIEIKPQHNSRRVAFTRVGETTTLPTLTSHLSSDFTKFGDNIVLPTNKKPDEENNIKTSKGILTNQLERERVILDMSDDTPTLPTTTQLTEENNMKSFTEIFAKEITLGNQSARVEGIFDMVGDAATLPTTTQLIEENSIRNLSVDFMEEIILKNQLENGKGDFTLIDNSTTLPTPRKIHEVSIYNAQKYAKKRIQNDRNAALQKEPQINPVKQYHFDIENISEVGNSTHVRVKRLVSIAKCIADKVNCTLICPDGSVSYVEEELDELDYYCSAQQIALTLMNCYFSNGILTAGFFSGYYSLKKLEIINCNLTTIEDGAFKKTTVQNLLHLELINNTITTLTAKTFEGLKSLEYFRFSQDYLHGANFRATKFLNSLGPTLQKATIMQITEMYTTLDPWEWWQGTDLVKLKIMNISNNNLHGVLSPETFRNLIAVEELHLVNCSLDFIDLPIFGVMQKLQVLNLSDNCLVTLDPIFLNHISQKSIQLRAASNPWNCDCTNQEMIAEMTNFPNSAIINTEDYVCFSPEDVYEMNMLDVVLNCESTTDTEDYDLLSSTTLTTEDQTIIECSVYSGATKTCFSFSVKSKIANLRISSTASASVTIISSYYHTDLYLVYFKQDRQYHTISQTSPLEWKIYNLDAGQSYVFCIFQASETSISPLDCRGHTIAGDTDKPWLSFDDMAWFVTVIAFIALNFFIIGMILVYYIQRRRPTWFFSPNTQEILEGITKSPFMPRRSR